ncbi:Mrp/NBP35 family ATP-binding protein [Paracoccaceae bacterium]|nr:Mrp/NBP35 family ATP-binding protein [Paracoccaceae bacterium]
MYQLVNKEYILNIIKKIDYPGNFDLTEKIESINVSEQKVKIIVNSEFTSNTEKLTHIWQSMIEKDNKITNCSVIYTTHRTPSLKQNLPSKNPQFLNKFDLSHLGKILFIASGKGGVGKSTISSNIASQIAEMGFKVGLMDADIYGPSQPKMLGLDNSKVEIKNKKISPKKVGNLSMMSMGMLFPEHEAIIWRGPMLMKAIQQLLLDVSWDNQDYFIVDLPPGTGDIHITLAQKVVVSGAIIISTPQDISLIDAKKAIALYNKTNTKIIGLIENMSYFECPKCGEKHNIFSSGGVKKVTTSENIAYLGSIPLSKNIMECADNGTPYVLHNSEGKEIFSVIVKNIFNQLNPI